MDRFLGIPLDPVTLGAMALMALPMVLIILVGQRQKRRENAWRSALELLAADLNLHPEPDERNAFVGEVKGARLWVGFKRERAGSRDTKYVPTLRLDVGPGLPRDFVVAPRSWNDALLTGLLQGIFSAEDPVLDKRFVFQCDDVPRAQLLVRHPAVREPLSRLGGDKAVACIEKHQVCLSFTAEVLGTEALHAHLEDMRAVVSALRVALAASPRAAPAHAEG